MNLQTFSASTMAEALLQVKRTLGHDAVILHTRTIQRRQWLGLRQREVVEVTAGPSSMGDRRRRAEAQGRGDMQRGEMQRGETQRGDGARGDGLRRDVNARTPHSRDLNARDPRAGFPRMARDEQDLAAARHAPRAGGVAAQAYARTAQLNNHAAPAPAMTAGGGGGVGGAGGVSSMIQSPEMAKILVKLVTEEVGGLRSDFKQLVEQIKKAPSINGPAVPSELAGHHERLVENGVSASLAEDLLKAARLQLAQGHLSNENFVREKIADQIERLLPVAGPIARTKPHGPHIVALIGPTGVGKTTTIAKLAANLQLQQGKRVALITLDTFRIAAVDQLRRYAEIIGSPLKVVTSSEEMSAAIASMGDMDYILIDTAGRSPTDSMKLSELRGFIDAASPDEVHLVLSTTSDPRCVDLAVREFSKVRVDRILFTKIDEAVGVGIVLNVAQKVGKPLSYITTGQDVPYDIEVARGREIAKLILGAPAKAVELKPATVVTRPSAGSRNAVAGGVQ